MELQVIWMQYKSTRDSQLRYSSAQVIAQGISAEGGLFVPEALPDLSGRLEELSRLDYRTLAKEIFGCFLTDFTPEEIAACVENAYRPDKFGGGEPVRLTPLTENGEQKYLLELWHGPTCAFKDMALQILPHFLTASLKKAQPGKEALILVATSGDTGKAALAGFQDVAGTRIAVFYPRDGVSPMQKRQMATQEGRNVMVCAIEGNFDDAQTAVKRIFTDDAMKKLLEERGMLFSSANSINWGRLLPQIVYYFYAYSQLVRTGALSLGEPMDVVVPTGNFGNILAAYYGKRMGLPVRKLVCASNQNKVLTDFIRTGVYDRRREFYATASPSMDILISSNLERLLYHLCGEDSAALRGWMEDLSQRGVYDVGEEVKAKVQELFYGGFCGDGSAFQTIRELWDSEGYLCDTHTAVAVDVYRQYRKECGLPSVPTVIASTADPYKFSGSVLEAIQADLLTGDDFQNVEALEKLTGVAAPLQLRELKDKPVRFSRTVPKEQAAAFVRELVQAGEG